MTALNQNQLNTAKIIEIETYKQLSSTFDSDLASDKHLCHGQEFGQHAEKIESLLKAVDKELQKIAGKENQPEFTPELSAALDRLSQLMKLLIEEGRSDLALLLKEKIDHIISASHQAHHKKSDEEIEEEENETAFIATSKEKLTLMGCAQNSVDPESVDPEEEEEEETKETRNSAPVEIQQNEEEEEIQENEEEGVVPNPYTQI